MSLKDKLSKARSKLSIKTYKRPQLFVILLMLLLNILILVVSAFIALVIDSTFDNFFDAFANGSLKWMLTPNAILLIDNPNTLILAVIVLVIGMVLFTGTIIALTTNAIKDYFQKKQSGSGKLILDHQIVILNWNNKVPELVADLIHLDKEDVSIVILADIEKATAEKLITNAIQTIKKEKSVINLNILVKKGNPLIKSDLYDISIEKAQTILIMNIDNDNEITLNAKTDFNLIKTILNLGEIEFIYHPPIVAEIQNMASKDKVSELSLIVNSLKEHNIIPICFDRRLGHVIAQTIINPLIKDVYLSIFSFEGAEVYFINDLDFNVCLKEFSHVIPIAKHNQGLFVLSEKDQYLQLKDSLTPAIIPLKTKVLDSKSNIKVIIIGSNNKLQFIKESFDDYTEIYDGQFEALYIDDFDLKNHINDIKNDSNKTILLLSREDTDTANLDANIINNLIYLQTEKIQNANIIVEVLDPANDHIIKDFNINNTIISNKIISLLVSKIIMYQETAAFYENLLTIKSETTGKDDQNISIMPVNKLFKDTFPLTFNSYKQLLLSFYEAFNHELMLIGYFRNKKLSMIYGNLHQKEKIEIQKDDLLIYIKI